MCRKSVIQGKGEKRRKWRRNFGSHLEGKEECAGILQQDWEQEMEDEEEREEKKVVRQQKKSENMKKVKWDMIVVVVEDEVEEEKIRKGWEEDSY